jgi:chondroitin 4-sulfotransferase 11
MISHTHQFIFVHVPRTGGSSFELAAGQPINSDSKTRLLGNTDFPEKHKTFEYYRTTYPIEFDNYYKFTIVRNPFDRIVSQWFWRATVIKDQQGVSLKEFIISRPDSSLYYKKFKLSGFSILDSLKQFDYIGRFEDIHNTYRHLYKTFNIHRNDVIHSNKTCHSCYKDYYTDETIELVNKKYCQDLELFNYKF